MRAFNVRPNPALATLFVTGAVQWGCAAYAQTPPADSFRPILNDFVGSIALRADGRVLIGGGFTLADSFAHTRLASLGADGTTESSFTAAASDTVYALAIQPDGKILVAGDFMTLGGQLRRGLGRLNANGSLDAGFNARLFEPPPPPIGGSITGRGQAVLIQPDGKIVVGGRSSYNGGPAGGFVTRVNTNGSPDTAFVTGGIGGGPVDCLALQPDGKILVGGLFSSVGNFTRYRLARLNANGSLDTQFNAAVDQATGTWVLSMALQADQKIVIGGVFNTVAGQARTNIARLNADGSLDLDFNPGATGNNSSVYSVAIQADGKILVGGTFVSLAGASCYRVGRLDPDGTRDVSFNSGANSDVYGLALQPDGKVLAGGLIGQLAGQPRSYVGRLCNLEPARQRLDYDGVTITWKRGGSSCEVWQTSFDFSTDGIAWVNLGDGTRTPEGWQLTNVALQPGAQVRARGYTTGGAYNSSSWFIETIWPPVAPAIATGDAFFRVRSNQFGFSVSGTIGSTVVAEGSSDMTNWTSLGTNVLASSTLYFSDPDWGNTSSRFYRARLW